MLNKEGNNKQNKYKEIIGTIKDNYIWIIALLTFIGTIILNVLKFIEYLTSSTYFIYFGLNHNLYQNSDMNYIYSLCLSIVFGFALFSVFYCFKQIRDNKRNHNILKLENLTDIFLIFISNLYMLITTTNEINLKSLIIDLIIMLVIEYFLSIFMFKEEKPLEKGQEKRYLINYLKIIPFMIIALIFLHSFRICLDIDLIKQYDIIEDNKVIVYTTNDYYLTLDCKIDKENNKLVIYKGSQEKIDNNNVKSQLTKFDKVERK